MKMIYTDSYFHIGEQHLTTGLPNQDYALTGATDEYAYAILADGCSSGRRTDVGARVLVHATERALGSVHMQAAALNRSHATVMRLEQELVVASSAQLLNLKPEDLLATTLYAIVDDTQGYVRVYGDGAVALVYRDGGMVLRRFSWEDNTPFYLAYANGRLDSFKEAHGNDLWSARLTEHVVHVEGADIHERIIEHTLAEGMYGIHIPITQDDVTQLEYIALFSDGVEQIEGESWVDVVQVLTRYKLPKGAFVKRRMMRALKEYHKESKRNLDDIASAVIRLAPDTEE